MALVHGAPAAVARDLLTDTGVIVVAIGDDEHHRLRMLLHQVFGKQNFLSDIVWQGGRKDDSRYVSNGADYMLLYAKDEKNLAAAGTATQPVPSTAASPTPSARAGHSCTPTSCSSKRSTTRWSSTSSPRTDTETPTQARNRHLPGAQDKPRQGPAGVAVIKMADQLMALDLTADRIAERLDQCSTKTNIEAAFTDSGGPTSPPHRRGLNVPF